MPAPTCGVTWAWHVCDRIHLQSMLRPEGLSMARGGSLIDGTRFKAPFNGTRTSVVFVSPAFRRAWLFRGV
ncbi:MAG: hypothetical protein ACPGXK_17000, partial [Phycisphaerae bacterium]